MAQRGNVTRALTLLHRPLPFSKGRSHKQDEGLPPPLLDYALSCGTLRHTHARGLLALAEVYHTLILTGRHTKGLL